MVMLLLLGLIINIKSSIDRRVSISILNSIFLIKKKSIPLWVIIFFDSLIEDWVIASEYNVIPSFVTTILILSSFTNVAFSFARLALSPS